jgi:hypothetical protein
MEVIVLVDYDNCRVIPREFGYQDVEYNLTSIVRAVTNICRQVIPSATELRLRFYGGWIAQDGLYTARAELLLGCLDAVRGLVDGMRLIPELAIGLARYCTENLVGLVRTDRNPPQQKMVDTLIAVDALHVSQEFTIAIVSDDDDLVPAAIGVSASGKGPVHLIRRRAEGRGRNDSLCRRVGVVFSTLPKEYQNGH